MKYLSIKSRLEFFGVILVCLTTLVGCHPGILLEIYNNSGENVTIATFDTKGNETRVNLANAHSVKIGTPSKLEIRLRAETWTYEGMKPVPPEFVKKLRTNVYIEKFQLEKTGRIYALPADATGVRINLSAQPFGYPIQPE